MSKFGWSYPPGCSGTPYDEDYPCEICGLAVDDCICPTCPICGSVGDPVCYKEHGMILRQEQIDSLKQAEAEWELANSEEYNGHRSPLIEDITDD